MGAQESPSWIMSEGPQGHELQLLLATGQEVLLTSATGHDLWHWATGQEHSLSLSLSPSLSALATGMELWLTSATGHDLWHSATGQE